MEQDYYLGLDLGSGSLGWAVTGENYEILRARGKALWGVRLFESAKTAEERRTFRTSRRRLKRRNWRIELLQGIFAEEINKIDDGFFLRMKESRYLPEDKRNKSGDCPKLPYALFGDKNYTDKDYHRQFPTIYHLRKWLMETEEIPDIRLVYLAFHHMMKHRGHFLLSGDIKEIRKFKTVFQQFTEAVKNEELDFELEIGEEQYVDVEEILKSRQMTRTAKKAELIRSLKAVSSCEKAILNLISGGTVKLSDIFGDKQLDDSERPKLSFSDAGYDEYASEIQSVLGEQYIIIEHAKAVYDWAILADILAGYNSISAVKVTLYEKHKEDLAYLKKLVKESLPSDAYKELFLKTDEKIYNYSAYVGMSKKNGKKQEIQGKLCSKDDFYKYLRKQVIECIHDEKAVKYLKEEIDKGTFLPRQVTKDNSVIPHQIHLYELNQILFNLQERIPLLKEQGEKIRKIFTFRIPYYVGPLNGVEKGEERTNWVKRKREGKVYPWNFEEIVDEEASAEQFIRRMTNKCTYLIHEDVLPKYSLMYSKFMVLNELNNLRLDGEPISVELKQKIYQEVFQRNRRVTQKKLKDYLAREGIAAKTVDITGIDGDFKSSLTAYHDFKEKLTGVKLEQKEKESIIFNITLFGEDKRLLKKRLKGLCPQLSDGQLTSLCNLPYRGWGRLSEKFLDSIAAPAPETGEAWTILRALWESNDNMMQLLSEKYNFIDAVEEENGKEECKEISYQLIQELYVSPAVRRQIWQTLLIVKELCKVLGRPPKRVFVEMAREKADSGRTQSRKKRLLELYKKCKTEEKEWVEELKHTDESTLRGDKLYLYYIQKGRCMYSGERIELGELWDNQKYDIDHIYPQSKIMDDSLNNRVLVKKVFNEEKSDRYPIAANIRRDMQPFWKSLLEGDFISKEKYERLIRATEFEPGELAGFIARQLVETRQGTKAVAGILKRVLPDTEIIYVKAPTVSQFRQDFKFIKVREMNDFHHAKDAYLNIVVGNVYFVKFTQNAAWFVKEHPGRSYNLKKLFLADKVERNGEIAWIAGESGTIGRVRRTMEKNNILVTRRSYEATGGLFDQQLMKKGKGQVPIKGNDERLQDIQKYGGYNKESGAYFILVESEGKKGKKIRTIEYVPIRLKSKVEQNEKEMYDYLKEQRGLKNPRVLLNKIKTDTLFQVDGFRMWISGRTENQLIFKGANQLLLPSKEVETLKKVLKFVARQKENKELKIFASDKIEKEMLIGLYDTFLSKLQKTVYGRRLGKQEKTLSDKRDIFKNLNMEEQCIVLSEILHMFQCQSGSSNLKLIGGPEKAGILVLNNDVTKCGQIQIIHQSPAGIYEQVIDLQKL